MKYKYHDLYIVLFLVGITCLVYFPILRNGFLDFWDDQWVVMNHYTESGLNKQNLYSIFMDFYHSLTSDSNV